MNWRVIARTISTALCAILVTVACYANVDSLAVIGDKAGTAVDMKGVRHTPAEYRPRKPPWLEDQIHSVAPGYPYADRAQHHEGTGVFRLVLDPKTGAVATVTMLKSSGFGSLDAAAVAALRQWRWKPGKWKEIDMPVAFKMGLPRNLPPSTTRLPPR